ncbi:MAG TPA: sigma-70 family RNA polymerase sigma factor [Candidatus Binatia bacterium]
MVGKSKSRADEKEIFSNQAMAQLDHLYRLAFHLVREPQEAQDLVQETYARALGSYEQFAQGTNIKAWLTRILYNFFFDDYHRKKKWVSVKDKTTHQEEGLDYWERVATDNPGPESVFLMRELDLKIQEALRRIPEEFRVPIVLVDMGDCSYAEVAEMLSCPIGTIRSRLSRGRRLLHRHLEEYVDAQAKGQKRK